MRKILLILTLCCALAACKHNTVDFTYSPSAPRAGQVVAFSNLSSSGEEWSWTYGDGAISTIKSPTHTYKQPGTYRVILKVDNKNKWTATKEITVYDTVPTFACEDTAFVVYKDYTFNAVVYNPYNYDVKYEWYLPESNMGYAHVTDTTMSNSALHLYFTAAVSNACIGLRVTLDGVTTDIQKYYAVSDRKTNSVLIRTGSTDYRQRIFGAKATEPLPLAARDTTCLKTEQDTMQHYNGYDFTLSEIASVFPGIEGFHIASRKIYFRANGLWVANIDGSYQVQIDAAPCSAMTLDATDSRIYWANAEGVWYMPFVGSDNNKFVTVPVQLNTLSGVTKIAADKDLK